MFADVSLSSTGTLKIRGDSSSESIVIERVNNHIDATVNNTTMSFAAEIVRRIYVDGGAGNDLIRNITELSSSMLGGVGDDRLAAGPRDDEIDGGPGTDEISYAERDAGVKLDVVYRQSESIIVGTVNRGNEHDNLRRCERFTTGRGDDVISLTNESIDFVDRAVVLSSGDGNDSVFCGIGNSFGAKAYVYLGAGDDSLTYESANSEADQFFFYGEEGDDTFHDQLDDDFTPFIDGGEDLDTEVFELLRLPKGLSANIERGIVRNCTVLISGNALDNVFEVTPSSSPSRVNGGDGDDRIIVVGPVVSEGEPGPLYADGGRGNDSIIGSAGSDSLVAGDGDDTLRGGDGDDTLSGGAGRDKLYGDAGDDLLLARGGSRDRVDGGDGTDAATRDNGPSVFDQLFNVETES